MELGSEFDLSLSALSVRQDNIFNFLAVYPDVVYFDSGRSALKHLASSIRQKGHVLLPEFICESVINCFRKNRISFYRLHDDFSVDVEDLAEKIKPETRYVFLMHYFGHVQPIETLHRIRELADKHRCTVIEDTTHSIFSKTETIGDYQICSIRKWLPVPGIGVMYSGWRGLEKTGELRYQASTDNERVCGMILKNLFLEGRLDCNAEYREIFSECENRLDKQEEICFPSDLSRFLVSCVSIGTIRGKRIRNYNCLRSLLQEQGIVPAIPLEKSECPLCLPISIPDRDAFRRYLMDHRVYCAVHWPFDETRKEERPMGQEWAKKLISLPVDQRYGEEEMVYLADVIHRYGGDLIF